MKKECKWQQEKQTKRPTPRPETKAGFSGRKNIDMESESYKIDKQQARKDGKRLKKLLATAPVQKVFKLVYEIENKEMEIIATGSYPLCNAKMLECMKSGNYKLGRFAIKVLR